MKCLNYLANIQSGSHVYAYRVADILSCGLKKFIETTFKRRKLFSIEPRLVSKLCLKLGQERENMEARLDSVMGASLNTRRDNSSLIV